MVVAAAPVVPAAASDLAVVEHSMAAAEEALRDGRLDAAAERYRAGVASGWLLLGGLEAAEGRPSAALDAFRRAADYGDGRAFRSLALVQIQSGQPAAAADTLAGWLAREP